MKINGLKNINKSNIQPIHIISCKSFIIKPHRAIKLSLILNHLYLIKHFDIINHKNVRSKYSNSLMSKNYNSTFTKELFYLFFKQVIKKPKTLLESSIFIL